MMSIRVVLRRFSFATMQSVFGSADPAVLPAVFPKGKHARNLFEPEKVKEVIRRAVSDGVPFKGLAEEGIEHVEAAKLLKEYKQKTVFVEMGDWKWSAYSEFEDDARDAKMPAAALKLVRYLTGGRPLFARKQGVSENYYAWLTLEEARRLHGAVLALRDRVPAMRDEDYVDGFVPALLAALAEVDDAGQDLWVGAS